MGCRFMYHTSRNFMYNVSKFFSCHPPEVRSALRCKDDNDDDKTTITSDDNDVRLILEEPIGLLKSGGLDVQFID